MANENKNTEYEFNISPIATKEFELGGAKIDTMI
jgi:hypothetical protein